MTKRKRNLKCNKPCTVCGIEAFHHHLKSFSSGGETKKYNLIPLCFTHHTEIHSYGLIRFAREHIEVEEFLIKNKWEIDGYRNKWVRYELDDFGLEN